MVCGGKKCHGNISGSKQNLAHARAHFMYEYLDCVNYKDIFRFSYKHNFIGSKCSSKHAEYQVRFCLTHLTSFIKT